MNYKKSFTYASILTYLVVTTLLLQAQEMEVPMNIQVPLFAKILTFDRNLKSRVGNEIVIGIIYQSKNRTSLNAKEEFANSLIESNIKSIDGIPITYIPIEIQSGTNLNKLIIENKIDVLYISPLRNIEMDAIISVSRSQHVLTLTGVPEYVENGISVGIGTKGEKPLIIVNSVSAKLEGADFKSQLLKLAKVIQ